MKLEYKKMWKKWDLMENSIFSNFAIGYYLIKSKQTLQFGGKS